MSSKKTIKKITGTPALLIIMDGWGIGPSDDSNAIYLAKTPNYDNYWKKYPHSSLRASSTYVGLPKGQDGNSEAGHMNIGAGRIVEQDSVMISRAINDGTFFKNPAFLQAAKHVKKYNSSVHLMGLLSDGQSAHSHPDHLLALITFFRLKGVKKMFLHLFTDGRDSYRYDAIKLLKKYHASLISHSMIASIVGRAYAMDRKKDWKHTKATYEALVMGKTEYTSSSAESAILHAYNRGETDEFIKPSIITKGGKPVATIQNEDTVVFFNLRSDRARQMAKPFCQTKFEEQNKGAFKRQKVLKELFFVAMTDFGPDLDNILTAFPSRDVPYSLPVVLADLRQLYVAESEKYAHMTYFFNGGYDIPIAGEDRRMVASPDTLSYVKNPKMSLSKVVSIVLESIKNQTHDFIGVNFSNADMIAHTGSLKATIEAIEYIDDCLQKVVVAILEKNGTVFITADHGNAEELVNRKTGEIDTKHSKSLVPFIMIRNGKQIALRKTGILADVAPTILRALGVKQPSLMTGKKLQIKK